ncbi:kunitz-type protease inhibitor 2 isoform X2 [Trichomycterus rosablanca]|uniref:kunitz-type protease inhibitor 2 isoform X2 n=1 Tax=Trichomycterus rosablanca TaxID=2290929 RepID=UPI002F354A63
MARIVLLALVCLSGLALVLGQDGCVWELKKNQGLNTKSLDAGASFSAHLPNITDPEECRQACCGRTDCQLALIGTPADDGTPECFLVNCMRDDEDVCVLEENSQYEGYRKTQDPESGAEASTVYCRFQAVKGRCRAYFPRFYYDVTSQTCEGFTYGGCGGNSNNFDTKDECESSCSGVTGDMLIDSRTNPKRKVVIPEDGKGLPGMTSTVFAAKCQAEPQVGLCRASIPRFYYKNGKCQRFTYGGCSGNENNYATEEECMNTCTGKKPSELEESKEYQEACGVPSDSGPCLADFKMVYFEPSTQSCQEFTYGGCKGNKNRYNTVEECISRCARKDGSFEEHGHSRWSPGFFLVGTLTIMCVVLLVGLILITVRRAQHRRLLTLDDKQELLPEWHVAEEDDLKTDTY